MSHELMLEHECRYLTRLHPSTRRRLERNEKFPRSFKIGDPDAPNGRKAWSRSEILAWLASRMAARNKGGNPGALGIAHQDDHERH
jgi:predicted DNA-binding transcriptional regulator AlpA